MKFVQDRENILNVGMSLVLCLLLLEPQTKLEALGVPMKENLACGVTGFAVCCCAVRNNTPKPKPVDGENLRAESKRINEEDEEENS